MENKLSLNNTPRPESITFFIDVVSKHNSVKNVEHIELPLFRITKNNNKKLNVLLVNIYIISESEFYEICSQYNQIDAIVNSSNWNGYSQRAKTLALEHKIGLFTFREFMGALNYDNKEYFINYLPPKVRDEDTENDRTAF